MTRLAITGHRGLTDETTPLVDAALREHLEEFPQAELVGLTCLADGADTLFARAVLDHGGKLTVVVPASEYRDGLPEHHHATYDALLDHAAQVIRLEHTESHSQAHMDASLRMITETDHLLAVWDGEPARGHGGTADVVNAAREHALPVTIIWPHGAQRT